MANEFFKKSMYVFTQAFYHGQDVTQDQFISDFYRFKIRFSFS